MRPRDGTFLRWVAIVRLLAVPFAVLQVALTHGGPRDNTIYAWVTTGVLAVAALAFYRAVDWRPQLMQIVGLAFDFIVASAFCLIYAWQPGTPLRQVFDLVIVEGTTLFATRGGVGVAFTSTPVLAYFEKLRSDHFAGTYRVAYVAFQFGVELLIALLVGWLVQRLAEQTASAESRAEEAESLRDELGRRADLLDAANRCARALSSSLDLDEAFGAFIRELRGLVPFERVAIVLLEGDQSRVIAAAGAHAEDVEPPGATSTLQRNLLADIVDGGQTVYRRDMRPPQYAEEEWMVRIGLRCRVASPLLVGARTIGMLSLSRSEPSSFAGHEVELVNLLGRLAASAVQNIRAYDSERRTVEELRRLSALRADFVSLVSHEMRSPMAAVIGAARTLEQRWRELSPDQREAFLALIADETTRLAALIGDVLDTSRIDAGTFSFRFADVDVGALVHEAVASASMAQDEVPLAIDVRPDLPPVRGDTERLRQVLGNLIDNAVKYSPAGSPVEVRAASHDHVVVVSVQDRGPGIGVDDQRLIFEKFGRVSSGNSKPGTGLGLYIARSIAEAHGGSLQVVSSPGQGSTFTLRLPS